MTLCELCGLCGEVSGLRPGGKRAWSRPLIGKTRNGGDDPAGVASSRLKRTGSNGRQALVGVSSRGAQGLGAVSFPLGLTAHPGAVVERGELLGHLGLLRGGRRGGADPIPQGHDGEIQAALPLV